MNASLFRRDFTMVVIGQIISLFGNNVLQYALPLYLLNQTHSAALFGLASACAFLPMILLAPVGGLVADRVNKRNVMVFLDFFTAALMTFYTFFYEKLDLVAMLIVVLMLLFGIQGAYQPTVQASIPLLVRTDNLMAGNAVINMVNSLASMIGPTLGGIVFSLWGLQPVLIMSIICFFLSAVMELFIHIPYVKQAKGASIWGTAVADMKESLHFIRRDCPEVGKAGILLASINLVFSSLIIIGIPVIISQHLGFSQAIGNQLYGYAQASLAAGGLLGGFLCTTVLKKLRITHAPLLVFLCTLSLLPIGGVLVAGLRGWFPYVVILLSCSVMMVLSTLLAIQLMTYMQRITPSTLIGKVMALVTCLAMCAHPLGQLLYGFLFQHFAARSGWIFLLAFLPCLGLCSAARRIFRSFCEPASPSAA